MSDAVHGASITLTALNEFFRAWLQDDAARGARASRSPEITIAHLDNHAGTCSNHGYERIRNLVLSGAPAGGTIEAAPVAGGRGGVRRYGPRGEEDTEMGRPATGRPSDMELAILKVLWDRGPSTVRQVLEVLEDTASDRIHDGAQDVADHA